MQTNEPQKLTRTLHSDAELVAACREDTRSGEAFRDLVDRHKGMVMYSAYRVLKDHHEAEDVAQEAFVKAYRSLGSLRDDSGFGSWVVTIARNTALSRAARAPRRPVDTGEAGPDGLVSPDRDRTLEDDPSSAASRRELHALALRELDEISEVYRRTIHLRFVKGHTCAEIAQMEGTAVSAITSRLSRATALLREKLERLTGGRAT